MAKRRKRKTSTKRRKKIAKSINLGNGFRLNISRSGINVSGGVTGARVSLGTKGLKTTMNIPGTDLKKTKTWVSTKDVVDVFKGDDKDDVKDKDKSKKKEETKTKDAYKKDDKIKVHDESVKADQISIPDQSAVTEAAVRTDEVKTQFSNPDKGDKIQASLPKNSEKRILLKQSLKLTPWFVVSIIGLGLLFLNLIIGFSVIAIGLVFVVSAYFSAEGHCKRVFNEGVEFYKSDKKAAAMEMFDQSLELFMGNRYILENIADIKMEEEDFPGAGKLFMELAKTYKSKKAKLGLGKCYLMNGQSKDAIPLLEPLLETYQFQEEELMEVQYLLGQAYMDELEFEKAKEMLEKVFEKDSEYENIGFLIERLS